MASKRSASIGRVPAERSVAATRWLTRIADFLLPPLCLSCRQSVDRHGELCPVCWARIDFIEPPICDRLGIPLPFGTEETQLSAAALALPPAYDRARAAVRYGDVARDLIHDFKFRDRHEGRSLFGRWLARAGRDILGDADLLVPVPLHRRRLWHRRYNQAVFLADAVSRLAGVPTNPLVLRRMRSTANQVGLTRDQRSRNVAGAFTVSDAAVELVRDRSIVLVDDVLTTGATVEACTRVLRRAKARRVDVLVLARVVDPLAPTP